MSVSVKAYLGNVTPPEIRRFQLPVEVSTSYDYLRSKIANIFPHLGSGNFQLCYKDVDGDMVRFSTDEELMMAMTGRGDDTFRVYITAIGDTLPQRSPDNDATHANVQCDVCNGSVQGIRYKCAVCPDYDLCESCERAGEHADHVMLRFAKPMDLGTFAAQFGPHFAPHFARMFRCHPYQRGGGSCRQPRENCGFTCGASNSQAAGGGAPANDDGADFLKNLGEGISNLLGSVGVDVHYDIEHNGPRFCPRGRCPKENASQTAGTSAPSDGDGVRMDTAASAPEDGEVPTSGTASSDATASSTSDQSSSNAQASASTDQRPAEGAPPFGQQDVANSIAQVMNLLRTMGFNADAAQPK